MEWFDAAQAMAGLTTVVVLLGLIVGEVLYPEQVMLTEEIIILLLSIASALLGTKILLERVPFIEITINEDNNGS